MTGEELKELFDSGDTYGKWIVVVNDELVELEDDGLGSEVLERARAKHCAELDYCGDDTVQVFPLGLLQLDKAISEERYWGWHYGEVEDRALDFYQYYPLVFIGDDLVVPVLTADGWHKGLEELRRKVEAYVDFVRNIKDIVLDDVLHNRLDSATRNALNGIERSLEAQGLIHEAAEYGWSIEFFADYMYELYRLNDYFHFNIRVPVK